jgi:drug/metabolite transporter (DMT)-like permease
VQISGLRILSGAAVISVLLLAKGGRLPTGARVWAHLFVCGFFLGALPFTLFALSETRISSALAGIGNATTPIVAVLATIAILPGERVTGSRLVAVLVGFLGVVTIMQPWTSVDRPDLVGFSMALVGGASYGIGWTYNRRFLSGVDLGGLSQPAATLLTALVLMVPVMLGWAAFQPEGLAAIWSYDTPDSGTWFWLPLACVLVLGLVGTGFAYMLQFDVVRGAGPVIGSTITYLIPVVSVLLGVFVLGESLGAWQLVGFAIVGRVGRGPAAPRQHGDDDGDQPQRDDGQQAADDLAGRARVGGAVRGARRRGEQGPGGQDRLGDRDTPEHEQQGPPLSPALAQRSRRPPRPPQQAHGDEHEGCPHDAHQAAVPAVGSGQERGEHPEPDGDHEQGRPGAQEHQARHPPAVARTRGWRVGRDGGGRHPGRCRGAHPSAGACTSRRRILPVGPFGSSGTTQTLRGYL